MVIKNHPMFTFFFFLKNYMAMTDGIFVQKLDYTAVFCKINITWDVFASALSMVILDVYSL